MILMDPLTINTEMVKNDTQQGTTGKESWGRGAFNREYMLNDEITKFRGIRVTKQ